MRLNLNISRKMSSINSTQSVYSSKNHSKLRSPCKPGKSSIVKDITCVVSISSGGILTDFAAGLYPRIQQIEDQFDGIKNIVGFNVHPFGTEYPGITYAINSHLSSHYKVLGAVFLGLTAVTFVLSKFGEKTKNIFMKAAGLLMCSSCLINSIYKFAYKGRVPDPFFVPLHSNNYLLFNIPDLFNYIGTGLILAGLGKYIKSFLNR